MTGARALLSDFHLARRPGAAFAAMGLGWGSFAAQVPVLKAQIGAGDALFGLILSSAAFGLACAMALAPALDRRIGGAALSGATLVLAVSFLLPGAAVLPLVFAAGIFLCSLCSGVMDVLMNARVAELEARHKRELMNLAHAIFSFCYASSAVLTGFLREAGAAPLAIFAVIGAIAALLAFSLRGLPGETQASGPAGAAAPLAIIVPGGLIVLVAFLAESSTESWAALHVERTLGGEAIEGALGPAMLGLTMGFGRIGGQIVAARINGAGLIAAACSLAAAGALVTATAGSPAGAYAGLAALGLGISVVAPTALAMVGRRATPGTRTRTMARVAVIGFSGFFFGPPLMGFLAEGFGLRLAFAAIAASCLAALLPLWALRRVPRR